MSCRSGIRSGSGKHNFYTYTTPDGGSGVLRALLSKCDLYIFSSKIPNMNKASSNGSRLESLTFLRFIAAAIVVIFHYGRDTEAFKILPKAMTSGPIMVTFFFVLSGFVIAVSHYQRKVEISKFYSSRLARIAPIYLIALAWTCYVTPTTVMPQEFIFSLTFLQSWIPLYPITINSPGWSISVEMLFYAVSPILLIVLAHSGERSWTKWIAASIAIWGLSQIVLSSLLSPAFYNVARQYAHDLIYYFPISHLCSFILGFASGVLYKQRELTDAYKKISIGIFLLIMMGIGVGIQYMPQIQMATSGRLALGSSFLSIVFMPAIYFCAVADDYLKRFLAAPIMVLLGEASYSLYILQKPVFLTFNQHFSQYFTEPDLKFASYFTILTLISICFYLKIEKPITAAIKSLHKRRTTAAQALPLPE